MIEQLTVCNFRSIRKTNVVLKPLTVVVGANSSGKSNLIRAMAFLGSVARVGLGAAVNDEGGLEGLVPKAVSYRDIPRTRIHLSYRVTLPGLAGAKYQWVERPSGEHEITFRVSRRGVANIENERIQYNEVLATARAWLERLGKEFADRAENVVSPSTVEVRRSGSGSPRYSVKPSLDSAVNLFVAWFGFWWLHEQLSDARLLRAFLEYIGTPKASRTGGEIARRGGGDTLLHPREARYTSDAGQAWELRQVVGCTKRYDLLLHELRSEQAASNATELLESGANMPSVLGRLDEAAIERVASTIEAIAPHICGTTKETLRNGKEFVEFAEWGMSRGVESWQAADGTLRALAILLALEAHPENSTLLVEEPEQNLHPWAVRRLVDHMREVISERNLQLVLTTHSPQVLDRLHPEELLVAQRSAEMGTEFATVDDLLPAGVAGMGEVSDLWVKGLLGGVPSDG